MALNEQNRPCSHGLDLDGEAAGCPFPPEPASYGKRVFFCPNFVSSLPNVPQFASAGNTLQTSRKRSLCAFTTITHLRFFDQSTGNIGVPIHAHVRVSAHARIHAPIGILSSCDFAERCACWCVCTCAYRWACACECVWAFVRTATWVLFG